MHRSSFAPWVRKGPGAICGEPGTWPRTSYTGTPQEAQTPHDSRGQMIFAGEEEHAGMAMEIIITLL